MARIVYFGRLTPRERKAYVQADKACALMATLWRRFAEAVRNA